LVNAEPDPIILPTIFKDDKHVEAPEINKLVKLVLFNKLVDVVFKLDIAVLLVFIKPNKLVDVVFKFDN
jgi:hypothetical protein